MNVRFSKGRDDTLCGHVHDGINRNTFTEQFTGGIVNIRLDFRIRLGL